MIAAVRLDAATQALTPPLLALDLPAFDANASDLVRRAGGTPIRLATKSLRAPGTIARALAQPGFAGLLTYAARESIELARLGHRDLLLAYPTCDAAALGEIAASPALARDICLMVDGPAHLDLIARAAESGGHAPTVCLDIDASWRLGPVHLGVRRSPVFTPRDAVALARQALSLGLTVRGAMFYEAQVAGLGDRRATVRAVKAASLRQLARRRPQVVDAVQHALGYRLELVNGGGTGSVELTAADPTITEVSAGSGLYAPTFFDSYRAFRPRPALFLALPVVRKPAARVATAFGGGYVASGVPGWDRLPEPVWPAGLRLLRQEGAGEVQTPVAGRAARDLKVGDRVWFRPTKAGEICERFASLSLVDAAGQLREIPTYRGLGWSFG